MNSLSSLADGVIQVGKTMLPFSPTFNLYTKTSTNRRQWKTTPNRVPLVSRCRKREKHTKQAPVWRFRWASLDSNLRKNTVGKQNQVFSLGNAWVASSRKDSQRKVLKLNLLFKKDLQMWSFSRFQRWGFILKFFCVCWSHRQHIWTITQWHARQVSLIPGTRVSRQTIFSSTAFILLWLNFCSWSKQSFNNGALSLRTSESTDTQAKTSFFSASIAHLKTVHPKMLPQERAHFFPLWTCRQNPKVVFCFWTLWYTQVRYWSLQTNGSFPVLTKTVSQTEIYFWHLKHTPN